MNSRRRQVFVISLILWLAVAGGMAAAGENKYVFNDVKELSIDGSFFILAVKGHDSSFVAARIIVPDRLLKDGVKVILNVQNHFSP